MVVSAKRVSLVEAIGVARAAGGVVLGWSGHRPEKLGGYGERVRLRLRDLARAVIEREEPALVVSGMALGLDQAAATAAIELGVPVLAMVPFVGQEGRWPLEARERYAGLIARAAAVHVSVSRARLREVGAGRALFARNADMVRVVREAGGSFAVVWDGSSGGTAGTVLRAVEAGVVVRNYWGAWVRHSGVGVE